MNIRVAYYKNNSKQVEYKNFPPTHKTHSKICHLSKICQKRLNVVTNPQVNVDRQTHIDCSIGINIVEMDFLKTPLRCQQQKPQQQKDQTEKLNIISKVR